MAGTIWPWILTKLGKDIIDTYAEFYIKLLQIFKNDDCGVNAKNLMAIEYVKC